MSGFDVDNVENVVVPPPPPRPDFFLSQHTPGARITCERLNGKNFAAWSCSVRLFLGGKGKSGWLLGTITKPNATDPKFVQWEIDNCTILGIVVQLHGAANLPYYFAYLQSRWEELAQYEPLSKFTTEGGIAARRLDRQHTYQFLMGCFKLHPELRETFKRKASPRTAAISKTSYGSPAAPTVPDLHQLQTQFQNQMEQLQLQFQTQLGSLMQKSPRHNPSPSIATLASGTPHSLNPR
ncbi:hypothetical protein Acr_13g0003530 [Actinidia rufa]|uniref:Retrotransposon Copia-like N-terminal domain-containing protein n=1 Tax=Actinidia rufa TaxID=165716 RepID=A0A7J0FJT0_9ERIC|nr:hypothetical protein Acr_13g0003530 [Actinidia rufa]